MKFIGVGLVVALLAVAPLRAQTAPCTYLDCALGIAPAWNGLDVVDGATGRRVSSLGFFWSQRVDASFVGSDSAIAYATKALCVRRAAAAFTDVGALLLGYAAARQLSGGLHGTDRVIAAVGVGTFSVGVPLQFSADGLLSRAVWWHNARYSVDVSR